jgi:hypothetical protein
MKYAIQLFSEVASEFSGNLLWDEVNGPRLFEYLAEAREEARSAVGNPIDPREWGKVSQDTIAVVKAVVVKIVELKK